MIILKKKLSASERERRMIRIPPRCIVDFPRGGSFEIIVNSKKITVNIGSGERLVGLGFSVFDELGLEMLGAIAVIETDQSGNYVLKCEK